MRALAIIVGIVAGLGGWVFAYLVFVLGMFFNLHLGHAASPLLALLLATPLAGTIGVIVSYFRPLAGRTLVAVSAAGWLIVALLLAYVRWQDQTKGPLSTADALILSLYLVGVLSIPALASLLAWWLALLAGQAKT